MPTRPMKQNIRDWQVLGVNLGERLTELPHLKGDHDALQGLIEEANTLEAQRDVEKSTLRASNHMRVEMARRGRTIERRIAAALRGHFGPESEELIRFGVKPFPREIRRRVLSTAEKAQRLTEEAARFTALAAAEAKLKEALKEAVSLSLPPPAAAV